MLRCSEIDRRMSSIRPLSKVIKVLQVYRHADIHHRFCPSCR